MEDYHYTAKTAANLQRHFFNRHYTHRLQIEEDCSVPSYCRACGILVSLHSLQRVYTGGKQCKANVRQNQQRVWNEAAAGAQTRTFIIDGVVLKNVEKFKYLGRQISSRDSDESALLESVTWLLERELIKLLEEESMWRQSYQYCCMVWKPGCGPQVCWTPYAVSLSCLSVTCW